MPTTLKKPKPPKASEAEGLALAGTPGLLALNASNGQWKMARHLELLDRLAVKLARRDIKRLIITLPPRHGKSSYISKWLAAWWLGVFPDQRVILTSYSADLAFHWSGQARAVLEEHGRGIFGVAPAGPQGGWGIEGRQGGLRAAGVGGPITGFGADLLIADDLVKNSEEAMSETVRESTWQWWNSTAWTRMEPDGVCVQIGTRWHLDDPIGRTLKGMQEDPSSEQWTLVNLPAIAEEDEEPQPIGLGRKQGEPLWPERFDLPVLEQIRKQLGEYFFRSLYQQSPVPPGGGMFKAEYFNQRVRAAPYHAKRVRFWDKAASEGKGCATAGVLMARSSEGNWYVEHVVWGQWEPFERDEKILATAHRDRDRYQKHEPVIYAEHEPGSSGVDSYKALARKLAGFRVFPDRPTGKKEVRAEPWASQCAAKNVYIVDDGTWDVAGYVEEHVCFPFGKLMDRVDGSSGAFGKLLKLTATPDNGMRTMSFGATRTGKKPQKLRIIVCGRGDMGGVVVEEASLLVCITDPPPAGTDERPAHGLSKLIGWTALQFLDIDPAEVQAQIERGETTWDAPIEPHGKPARELMMAKDHGKKFWHCLTCQRGEPYYVLVIVDSGGTDRRAASLAQAAAKFLRRPSSIWRPGDPEDAKHDGPAPNQHIFETARESRHMVA